MYTRLLSFITKHDILYALQFGFRKFHSPNLALIILAGRKSKVLENGDFVLGLFQSLRYSKPFYTVQKNVMVSEG